MGSRSASEQHASLGDLDANARHAAKIDELLDNAAGQEFFTRDEVAQLLSELRDAQSALQASAHGLSQALHSASAALWNWDPATHVFQWTPHLERTWGLELGFLRTVAEWRDHIHPDDFVRALAEYEAAIDETRPFATDVRLLLPDGQRRSITVQGHGIYDDAGTLIRVAGAVTDITARKAAEAAQQAGDARIRAQWESSPVASFIWKMRDDGQLVLVEVNPAAERLSQGKAHEFLGMTAEAIYPDNPDMLACFHACLEEQSVIRHTTDYRARGTGRQRVIEFTFAFVPPDGILLHANDLTELRRAEEDLRFTQAVVDRMGDATYWAAEDGRLVYVNEASCAQLGYSRAELLGRPIIEIIAGATPAKWQMQWQTLEQHGGLRFETGHVRKDGSIVPVEVQVSLIRVGDTEYACGIARDVSERRTMEAALRASEAKFAQLFELTPIGLAITLVEDGAFLEINEAFARLTGYARSQLLGHSALERQLYANPADRAAILAAIEQNGQVAGYPVSLRTSAGTTADCLISMTPVSINDVPCLLAGIVDVGPLRQAEEALRAQQADMLALLENTDGIIWSIDAEYRLTACNSVFRAMVSAALGREPIIGASVFAAAQVTSIDEWRAHYDRALAGERFAVELQRWIGGQLRWQEFRFSPVRSAGGAITGVTVLGRDVTERLQAARQIEEQLAEISLYYDTAPVGLAVLDTDLRFLRINKLLAAMNGVPAADHIGKTVEEVVPLLADQAHQIAATILATGEPVIDIEFVGETPAAPGVTHYWKEYWYPIHHNDGTIIGFNVTAEDITERKLTRARLERSEQNLAHAQQVGHLGSWEWDIRNDHLEWSDELYRIFGVDQGFAPSYAAIEALVHPEDRAFDTVKVEEMLASGSSAEFEIRIVRPDGVIRHIYENIEILRDELGAPLKLFGIVQDITERKLAEEALQRSVHALNEAERISHSGSWDYDIATGTAVWSENMSRVFDATDATSAQSSEEILDPIIQGLILPDDRQRVHAAFQAAIHGDAPFDIEYRIAHGDGSIHDIHVYAEFLHDDAGRAVRMIGRAEDITERKRAAAEREQLQAELAQAQKMETVGRLAGGIAHDFNNMLAVILLRTELSLQMITAGTPLHHSLMTVHTTAQRSANLVQQLLGFARKQTIAPKVMDLNAAVQDTLPMLARLIGEEIKLLWQPGADVWPVKMDASQVDQILTNLCVNARDAIDGIGTISIATANATLPHAPDAIGAATVAGDFVMLSVTDTGSGMAPELLDHIFEPFYTTKAMGKGTGLGLATVEGIIEQNRGYIQVASTPGSGTTFAIYLPRFAEPAPAAAAPVVPALARGEGQTLLLVEDEIVVLEMASEALRSLGYTVIAASTPGAALRASDDDAVTIDLLITDMIMPEINGAILAERVRQRRPAIKTLFVSGYPADYMATRGLLASDAHFLAKPFTMQRLAATVAEVLGEAG